MRYEYPEYVYNIGQLLQWFDKEKERVTGKGLSSSDFSYLGGHLKTFIESNNLTIEEFKILLWGVMNETDKVRSPVYAQYFLDDLDKYKEIYKKYKNFVDKEPEIEYNSDSLLNEENDIEEEFFDEL